MNIVWAKARIRQLIELDDNPNQWAIAMDEAGDYHHLDTLSRVQDGSDCKSWRVYSLLDYMERVAPHIEREDV
jgi:hypothetical protein